MPYTEVSISNYNATPPTDDGATGSANQITWDGVEGKLGDPLDDAFEDIDDNVASACGTLDTAVTTANSTLSTVGTNLTTALTALYAPAGTIMLFVQTAAPTLWTKSVAHNDKALRLVSGTVSSGGTVAFTDCFGARSLGEAMPDHTHDISKSGSLSFNRTSWTDSVSSSTNTSFTSGGNSSCRDFSSASASFGTVTISFSGTTTSTGDGEDVDFDIDYVDCILATKN